MYREPFGKNTDFKCISYSISYLQVFLIFIFNLAKYFMSRHIYIYIYIYKYILFRYHFCQRFLRYKAANDLIIIVCNNILCTKIVSRYKWCKCILLFVLIECHIICQKLKCYLLVVKGVKLCIVLHTFLPFKQEPNSTKEGCCDGRWWFS